MVGTAIAPALPIIQQAFIGHPHVELMTRLVLSMPALFTVISAPLAGAASDRFGRKKLLVAALILFAISGVSGYFAPSLEFLLIGRALLGVSVGITMTTSTALIADYYEGQDRAGMLGLQFAVMTAGAVVCLGLGGFLADIGWREPFLIYLFAAAILPVVVLVLYEPKREPVAKQTGSKVSARGLIGIILPFTLIGSMVIYSVPVQIPFYLNSEFHIGGFASGLVIAAGTVFSTITASFYGRFRRRFIYPVVLATSYLLMGARFILVGRASSVYLVVAGLCLVGAASGLQMPTLNNWLTDIVSSSSRGKVLGGLTTAIFLGQFLSPLVLTPLLTRVSYSLFFAIIGTAMLLMWLMLLAISGYLERLTREAVEGLA